ncbi:MAG: GntR family transcriptional regulator [Gemmatimonadetes bacterium]|nr:GntR family transcriptional regulator [Gemmatimonadota bacterium]
MDVLSRLDGEGPLYRRLYSSIHASILSDRTGRRERLPVTRELACQPGVSRTDAAQQAGRGVRGA